jgi:hypothetical protein
VGTHSDKEEKRKRWRLLERSGVYKERMCAPHRQALESQLVRFHAKKERKKGEKKIAFFACTLTRSAAPPNPTLCVASTQTLPVTAHFLHNLNSIDSNTAHFSFRPPAIGG